MKKFMLTLVILYFAATPSLLAMEETEPVQEHCEDPNQEVVLSLNQVFAEIRQMSIDKQPITQTKLAVFNSFLQQHPHTREEICQACSNALALRARTERIHPQLKPFFSVMERIQKEMFRLDKAGITPQAQYTFLVSYDDDVWVINHEQILLQSASSSMPQHPTRHCNRGCIIATGATAFLFIAYLMNLYCHLV